MYRFFVAFNASRSRRGVVLALALLSTVMTAVLASPPDAAQVNRTMREAERQLFAGRADEADGLLKQAEAGAEQILAAGDDEQKAAAARLESKLKTLRAKIDRKLGQSAPLSETQSATSAPSPSNTELPSYVVSRLEGIHASLSDVQQSLDQGDLHMAATNLAVVRERNEKIQRDYAKYLGTDHPEIGALEQRIAALEQAIAASERAAADQDAQRQDIAADGQRQSDVWVERLAPYLLAPGMAGHDPGRYFSGYTESEPEAAGQNAIYENIQADLAEYRAAGPAAAASEELVRILRDLDEQVSAFQRAYAAMGQLYLDEASDKIGLLANRVAEETARLAAGADPTLMSAFAFAQARSTLDKAAGLLGDDDTRVKDLDTAYSEALAGNQELIRARIADTRVQEDQFRGDDSARIRETAESVLKKHNSETQALQIAVISPDWQEERVIEWTDTSKSALRHRTTHSVSVQIAGKSGDKVTRYTILVAKDKTADGGFGPLRGHIMFEDEMLEENVSQ